MGLLNLTDNYFSVEEKDKREFNKIWHKYYRRVWLFTKSILKIGNIAVDDMVQEIMLKVFKNLDKYKSKYSFSTWIFTIARNCCLDHINKKNIKTNMLEENQVKSIYAEPDEALHKKNTEILVQRFIENLKDVDSELAFLRFYENLKIKEISRILKIPEGTVKYKIHNIKKALKKFLKEEGYEK